MTAATTLLSVALVLIFIRMMSVVSSSMFFCFFCVSAVIVGAVCGGAVGRYCDVGGYCVCGVYDGVRCWYC